MIFYTDGSCLRNPGSGAYAWSNDTCRIWGVSKIFSMTTNNRMEIMACIDLMRVCVAKKVKSIRVYSDSRYLVEGFNNWIYSWRLKNFFKIKNSDLWKALDYLGKLIKMDLRWVEGHSDSFQNNFVHKLCYSKVSNRDVA